jgi:cytochrome P450
MDRRLIPGANPIAPPDVREEAERAAIALYAYVAELAERRRREPRNDLLDALLAAEEAGDRLSSTELQDMVLNILLGGHDTVRSLLGIAVMLLLRHPDILALARSSPDAVPAVVEEVLRFESPVMFVPRVANEEVALGDVAIPAGDSVLLCITAANRDPRRFRDPGRFDITRGTRADLAFGRGLHFCIGAALARAEARELLSAWLFDGPRLELAEEPAWVPYAAISRRLQTLMVRAG